MFLSCTTISFSQIRFSDRVRTSLDFPLSANGKTCRIYIDAADYEVVGKVANFFV